MVLNIEQWDTMKMCTIFLLRWRVSLFRGSDSIETSNELLNSQLILMAWNVLYCITFYFWMNNEVVAHVSASKKTSHLNSRSNGNWKWTCNFVCHFFFLCLFTPDTTLALSIWADTKYGFFSFTNDDRTQIM